MDRILQHKTLTLTLLVTIMTLLVLAASALVAIAVPAAVVFSLAGVIFAATATHMTIAHIKRWELQQRNGIAC